MKFGKHLQKRQLEIPEYAASFVDYKTLKKLIKQLSATPTLLPQNASSPSSEPIDPRAALQANRATFFFKVDCELNKVNAFYLLKEAELKLRLKTLLDKKRVMQARSSHASKASTNFVALEEGFQQFGHDLNKLQQFVEVNATAFSKILKKWDKASKSRTKELYLSRAVEVQPCFNRDVISDLSDQATTSLLELGAWAEGENIQYGSSRLVEHTVIGQAVGTDNSDTDAQILQAATAGNTIVLKEWIDRLKTAADASDRFTRIYLASIAEAPEESVDLLISSKLVDIHAEDDINERNCLHEAAISGRGSMLRMGLKEQVDVSRVDVYGRIPLHYACMHGHVAMVQALLQAGPQTIDELDHDNFTPLVHSVVNHRLDCAKQLLSHGVRINPHTESDHVPLNLACQYGAIDIAHLLLENNAEIVPDAEGLYPQHLLAKSGQTPSALLEFEQYGANLDQCDKLYQWTPLFHAAAEGRLQCIQILLQRRVDENILDEKGLSALYYAAWEGHLECMKLLSIPPEGKKDPAPSSLSRAIGLSDQQRNPGPSVDADGIPDLSLPPPIIPLRRYGHNFLDNKSFIQLTFEANSADSIHFYDNNQYPAARLTISSKSSDVIPRNIMLPIQEDFRIISFQINRLESFTLDFEIFPTFGSKVIAKSVALSNLFTTANDGFGQCCLPLFDPRLRAIGQTSFKFQVIHPFRGNPLDITHFATYWRATSPLDTHPTSAYITGSSLSGNYVQLFVQVTADGTPVLCPTWTIKHLGIEVSVVRISHEQFKIIGPDQRRQRATLEDLPNATSDDIPSLHRVLAESYCTLRDVLHYLPTSIHVDIEVLYPCASDKASVGLCPPPDINAFADAILGDVFDHARSTKEHTPDFMRSIVFTSYNADICTALNWKQPNYPVLLRNDLGSTYISPSPPKPTSSRAGGRTTSPVVQSSGHSATSVKEAVRAAQNNNFMGLVCSSKLLGMVPSLIETITAAGLVLVADTSEEDSSASAELAGGQKTREGVNGVLRGDGVLRFSEVVDM